METHLTHPVITEEVQLLKRLRGVKKEVESQEKQASEEVKAFMEEFGLGKYYLDGSDGLYTFSFIEGKRTSLSKDLLLEAGVDPSIVEKCMKTTMYRYIGEIKHEPA